MAKEANNEEFVKRCRLRNKTDKKLINDVALSMASKTALRVIAVEALERESNACGRLEQLQYDLETEEKAHETTRGEWQKQQELLEKIRHYLVVGRDEGTGELIAEIDQVEEILPNETPEETERLKEIDASDDS